VWASRCDVLKEAWHSDALKEDRTEARRSWVLGLPVSPDLDPPRHPTGAYCSAKKGKRPQAARSAGTDETHVIDVMPVNDLSR
jgi:hypothetical protein